MKSLLLPNQMYSMLHVFHYFELNIFLCLCCLLFACYFYCSASLTIVFFASHDIYFFFRCYSFVFNATVIVFIYTCFILLYFGILSDRFHIKYVHVCSKISLQRPENKKTRKKIATRKPCLSLICISDPINERTRATSSK